MIQKGEMKCALMKQIVPSVTQLGIVSVLGTRSPALTGCSGKEVGVSPSIPCAGVGLGDLTDRASLPYIPRDGFSSFVQALSFAVLLPRLQKMVRQCKPQKSESMCKNFS